MSTVPSSKLVYVFKSPIATCLDVSVTASDGWRAAHVQQESNTRPRQSGMDRIVLHGNIAHVLEVIDPLGSLGQDIAHENNLAVLPLEGPRLIDQAFPRLLSHR